MSSHLGNVMSAAEKSSGLADVQVEIKDSASDYESCYNVGHCEPSSFSSTLPVDATVSVLVVMHWGVFNRTTIGGPHQTNNNVKYICEIFFSIICTSNFHYFATVASTAHADVLLQQQIPL